jgi:hypothetical protein
MAVSNARLKPTLYATHPIAYNLPRLSHKPQNQSKPQILPNLPPYPIGKDQGRATRLRWRQGQGSRVAHTGPRGWEPPLIDIRQQVKNHLPQ